MLKLFLSVLHAAFNQTPPYILKYKYTSSVEHECQICQLFSLAHDVVSHNIPVRDICRYVYFCNASVHRQVHSVQWRFVRDCRYIHRAVPKRLRSVTACDVGQTKPPVDGVTVCWLVGSRWQRKGVFYTMTGSWGKRQGVSVCNEQQKPNYI